jgi:hypothetical protein
MRIAAELTGVRTAAGRDDFCHTETKVAGSTRTPPSPWIMAHDMTKQDV